MTQKNKEKFADKYLDDILSEHVFNKSWGVDCQLAPVKTRMLPCTASVSELPRADMRISNNSGQLSGQSQVAIEDMT